jgi:hypothetical protein
MTRRIPAAYIILKQGIQLHFDFISWYFGARNGRNGLRNGRNSIAII